MTITLGIFAKVFPRPTLDETLDAVVAHGLPTVQFNMASAGLDSMPDQISADLAERVRAATASRGIRIAALSATFNMAHPDPAVRDDGLARFGVLAAAARPIGTSILTLCTGTRHPTNMWHGHPDNATPAARRDLLATLDAALAVAETHDLTLAIEPEPANIIDSATAAHDLLRAHGTPRLGIILDPANILAGDPSRSPADLLTEAFDLLAPHIVLAHGKDLSPSGEPCAAGTGIVPWGAFLVLLASSPFPAPLILHGLDEAEVPAALGFLRQRRFAPSGENR